MILSVQRGGKIGCKEFLIDEESTMLEAMERLDIVSKKFFCCARW